MSIQDDTPIFAFKDMGLAVEDIEPNLRVTAGATVVTIGKGEPGHVRWTGNDGSFYDMPKAIIPEVVAALVRFAVEA